MDFRELVGGEHRPVCLNITAVPEDGVFKLSRFHISKNNVRRQWFLEEGAGDSDTGRILLLKNLKAITHLSYVQVGVLLRNVNVSTDIYHQTLYW